MLKQPHLVFIPRMMDACKECGCECNSCFSGGNSLDLHREIEEMRSKLIKSQNHVSQMERDFVESREYSETEITKLQDELTKLRDRYDRLFESHKKLQKLNHNLEDKLLNIVMKFDTEKTSLQNKVTSLSNELTLSKILICDLEEECENYRVDCNTAVQLLHCRPDDFVAHRLHTLPLDLQERVKSSLTGKQIVELEDSSTPSPPSPKLIRVPMPTFPPTAMVYSINTRVNDPPPEPKEDKMETVPMSIIADVLAQPETNRKPRRVYICEKCKTDTMFQDQETQTSISVNNVENNSFHKNFMGSTRSPQTAILIQPTVHKPQMNSTETETN